MRFEIDSNGDAIHVAYEGHPLFKQGVESVIKNAHFELECRGVVELEYQFVLTDWEAPEGGTTMIAKGPNRFIVSAPTTGIICILYGRTRRSWFRRVFPGR